MRREFYYCFLHVVFSNHTLYQHVIIPAERYNDLTNLYAKRFTFRIVEKKLVRDCIPDFDPEKNILHRGLLYDGNSLLKTLQPKSPKRVWRQVPGKR